MAYLTKIEMSNQLIDKNKGDEKRDPITENGREDQQKNSTDTNKRKINFLRGSIVNHDGISVLSYM